MYGLKLYRERYAKSAQQYQELLSESERYPADEIRKYQTRKMVELIGHAIHTVPYYREYARNHSIRQSDIQCLEDIKKFPILRKESIRSQPEKFLSDDFRQKRKLIKLGTSGTTGTPLTVFCDRDSRTFHYAFFSRLRSWFGLKPRSRRVTLFGRIIILPEQNRPPFWRYDFAQNNLLMSSYHLSESNLHHYHRKLRIYEPEEVIAYPSSVYHLARYIKDKRLEPLKPKVVITTAETLLQYQKETIKAAFDAPLVNQYGCTEMSFFASSCEHGTMHLHPEHGIVETVDENSNNITGEPGRLIVTGFINRAMPLIRYDIGDLVTLADKAGGTCECGRAFPIIKQVEGRIDDILYRRDGTPVGRLDPVFKGGSHIIAAKIVQKKTGDVQVLVQPSKDFNESTRTWLVYELSKRMGERIEIEVKMVDDIPKEKNAKFKAVESHYRV
jgi:phenylacetate-CoA ligase